MLYEGATQLAKAYICQQRFREAESVMAPYQDATFRVRAAIPVYQKSDVDCLLCIRLLIDQLEKA